MCLVTIPQPPPLLAFVPISTFSITLSILSICALPAFGPFPPSLAIPPEICEKQDVTDLRLQVQILRDEDPQDFVQVTDPSEVQRGCVVPHLVPSLRHNDIAHS